MKKLILLLILIVSFSSCSNMESDAEKVCELITESSELLPEVFKLGMGYGFGDEESKNEAKKKLDEVEAKIKSLGVSIEVIKMKYDEDVFEAYLLDNCETAKNLNEMGKALEGIGDSLENN